MSLWLHGLSYALQQLSCSPDTSLAQTGLIECHSVHKQRVGPHRHSYHRKHASIPAARPWGLTTGHQRDTHSRPWSVLHLLSLEPRLSLRRSMLPAGPRSGSQERDPLCLPASSGARFPTAPVLAQHVYDSPLIALIASGDIGQELNCAFHTRGFLCRKKANLASMWLLSTLVRTDVLHNKAVVVATIKPSVSPRSNQCTTRSCQVVPVGRGVILTPARDAQTASVNSSLENEQGSAAHL